MGKLPIHFFTIVLNGEPFIRRHLPVFQALDCDWHWHIVEGVAELTHDTGWSLDNGGRITDELHHSGLSNDGTSAYLDELAAGFPGQITIYRKKDGAFWNGKVDMVAAPLANIAEECLLWQVDADELWTIEQIQTARQAFLQDETRTAAYYFCRFYVGPDLVISTRDTYGNNTSYEWLRTWRYRPGDRWASHEPPRLCRQLPNGNWVDLAQVNPFRHAETEAMQLVFLHYAYVIEQQLRFKEIYYGYSNAVTRWKRLQEATSFPVLLRDYFPWVHDGALVQQESETKQPCNDSGRISILFLRPDSIGDNVLAASMLPHLKLRYPNAAITVVCQEHIAELYQACPLVNRVIGFDRRRAYEDEAYRFAVLERIRDIKAHLALNSRYSREPVDDFFAIGSGASTKIAFNGNLCNITREMRDANNRHYTMLLPSDETKSELERHRDFLKALDIDAPNLAPLFWTSTEDDQFADEFFSSHKLQPDRCIALFAGAQSELRTYPNYGKALARAAIDNGHCILAFGTSADYNLNQHNIDESGLPGINLSGKLTLRQTAAILRQCGLALGAETGTAHIACAVCTPNVILLGGGHFGRFMPYSPLTSVVCLPLDCYFCNWECRYQCTHCVKDLDPGVIAEAIRQTLEAPATRIRIFREAVSCWHATPEKPHWQWRQELLHDLDVEVVDVAPQDQSLSPAAKENVAGPSIITRNAPPPKISIVTPSLNQGHFLEECIDSILSQHYPNLEYIIMDGGSSDKSVEIIRRHEKSLAHWQSCPDAGQYHAIDAGLKRSTGQIMTWLNADDKLQPGTLELVANVFIERPEVEWLTGRPNSLDESGVPNWQCDHLPLNSRQRFLDNDIFIQQEGTFWSRFLWERAGGTLRTDLTYAGDYELWGRFFRYAQLFAVDALLAAFRDHPAQKSKARDKYSLEARTALDRELLLQEQSRETPLPAPLPIIIADKGTAMNMTAPNQSGSPDEVYQGIVALANAGWNDLAITALERLITEQPDRALAHNDLGVLYFAMGDDVRSLDHYREAVRLKPSDPTFTKNLADMYFAVQGKVEEALQLYLKVLQANANDLEALFAIGHISQSQGKAEDARTFFMRVLELEPTHQATRLAVQELDQGKPCPGTVGGTSPTAGPKKAIAELENLLSRSPDNALAHNDLGVLYFQAGEDELALAHYQEAVRLMPENRTFMKNLADFYYLVAKRYEEAVNLYVQVIEADRDDLEALLALGTIATEAGQPGAARTYFRKALCVDPLNPAGRQQIDIIEGFPDLPLPPADGSILVSAIVSTYNAARFLPGCLDDLEGQTIADRLEIVVVDSGSSENERQIVADYQGRYNNIIYIRTEERETVYGAWNRAIQAARGQFITNANTDDRHAPDALERMARILAGRPEVALVYADVIITETENEVFGRHTRIGNYNWLDWDRDALLHKGCFIGPQPMWRRSLHEEYGYFDASLTTSGDYEFWLRISQTHPFYHLGMPLGLYLKSPDSVEHRNAHLQEEENTRILMEYRQASAQGAIIRNGGSAGLLHQATPAAISPDAHPEADRLVEEGKEDEAIKVLLQAATGSPADSQYCYRRIAEILIGRKYFAEALETLAGLPDDSQVAALKGYCLEGLDRDREADALAEKVLTQSPGYAPALNLQGVLAYKAGDRNAAEGFFRQAIEADATYGEPCTNLGVVQWSAGNKDVGLDWLEKGLVLDPFGADHATHYHAAICGCGDLARGERIFREILQRTPHDRLAANLLVDLLLRQEKYEQALTEAKAILVRFGVNDDFLDAALAVKEKMEDKTSKKQSKPVLSLCMIVRNEVANLPRCLNSVTSLADEIIVVDTGSSDRTKDIAQLFGGQVYDFAWENDFAAARNFALEKATGTWILILDADEVIAAKDAAEIQKLLQESAKPAAYSIVTRNYVTEVNTEGWTANDGEYPAEEAAAGWVPSTKVRLFPNDPRIRFEKQVHEMVEYSLERAKIPMKACPVPVHHYGKLDKRQELAKGETYLQLGKNKLAGNGADAQGIYELGVQAANLGKYREAIELFQRVLQVAPKEPMALFNLSSAQFRLGNYREALTTAEQALALKQDLKEAACTYAMCQLYIGDIQKAIEAMEQVLKQAKDYPPAMATLATAYCCAGKREKASALIDNLVKLNYNDRDFLQDHADRLAECQRPEWARLVAAMIPEAGVTCGELGRNRRGAART